MKNWTMFVEMVSAGGRSHPKQIKQLQKTFHKTKIRNGENALFHALYRKEFFSVEAALHTLMTLYQDQPLKNI